jgi:hypothetical protein
MTAGSTIVAIAQIVDTTCGTAQLRGRTCHVTLSAIVLIGGEINTGTLTAIGNRSRAHHTTDAAVVDVGARCSTKSGAALAVERTGHGAGSTIGRIRLCIGARPGAAIGSIARASRSTTGSAACIVSQDGLASTVATHLTRLTGIAANSAIQGVGEQIGTKSIAAIR